MAKRSRVIHECTLIGVTTSYTLAISSWNESLGTVLSRDVYNLTRKILVARDVSYTHTIYSISRVELNYLDIASSSQLSPVCVNRIFRNSIPRHAITSNAY